MLPDFTVTYGLDRCEFMAKTLPFMLSLSVPSAGGAGPAAVTAEAALAVRAAQP